MFKLFLGAAAAMFMLGTAPAAAKDYGHKHRVHHGYSRANFGHDHKVHHRHDRRHERRQHRRTHREYR